MNPKQWTGSWNWLPTFAARDAPGLGMCPYKGMSYFEEADADLFIGRELLTAKIVRRLISLPAETAGHGPRCSPSSAHLEAGKSSLVRAGVIPALRWNKTSVGWDLHILTPKAHPLESLAASLTRENEFGLQPLLP